MCYLYSKNRPVHLAVENKGYTNYSKLCIFSHTLKNPNQQDHRCWVAPAKYIITRIVKKVDLWPLCVTFTLNRETPNWDATCRVVMIHEAMKLRQIIFSWSDVTVRTRRISKTVWPLTSMCDLHLEARDPNLGRDTPPCHDTRIYKVWSNYL
jgi:hypothetical protein